MEEKVFIYNLTLISCLLSPAAANEYPGGDSGEEQYGPG